PTGEEESQLWAQQLTRYLAPYHERLDAYLDRRVVGNLTATVAAIVQTRTELTTSALGSAICGPAHAEAGTQRLQRALHHQGWEAEVIEEVLWQEAEKSRKLMQQQGETPLCIWDSSVLEKPESEKLQGLGAVRSSRVRRLARSRKGLFNQPSRMPVSVRGFEWESLLLLGSSGVPQVVAMKWWSRHKGVPGQQRQQQHVLLSQVAQRWGRQVRHVFDRGYGNGPWLWLLWRYQLRFVVRWKKGNKLIDASGQERQAWEIVFSSVSRWKIEESFRFQKCELLIESLRLQGWPARRKMLLLVTLAYGFLLSGLSPPLWLARGKLLLHWCQRADWRLWRA